MTRKMAKTTERIDPEQWFTSREEYLLYLRHEFAYEYALTLVKPDDSVLEVGSGDGYGTAMLARAAACVVGLDVDAETVDHASAKYGSGKVSFKLYDGTRMPFEESSFDMAVSFQVIEHVADVPGYVAELHRVLKPGGTLALTTPNRTYRLKPGQKPWNRFHLREYDPAGLAVVLKASFPSVNVWGIRGSDEMQAIEHARVAWALRSGPVSVLRRAMPEPARRFAGRIQNLLSGARTRWSQPDFRTQYGLADYFIIKEEVGQSLDLLAVCTK
jgi:SAM-dependent methyltransferase